MYSLRWNCQLKISARLGWNNLHHTRVNFHKIFETTSRAEKINKFWQKTVFSEIKKKNLKSQKKPVYKTVQRSASYGTEGHFFHQPSRERLPKKLRLLTFLFPSRNLLPPVKLQFFGFCSLCVFLKSGWTQQLKTKKYSQKKPWKVKKASIQNSTTKRFLWDWGHFFTSRAEKKLPKNIAPTNIAFWWKNHCALLKHTNFGFFDEKIKVRLYTKPLYFQSTVTHEPSNLPTRWALKTKKVRLSRAEVATRNWPLSFRVAELYKTTKTIFFDRAAVYTQNFQC